MGQRGGYGCIVEGSMPKARTVALVSRPSAGKLFAD
jgi:hypothetical protein